MLIDSTLREGAQAYGVALGSWAEKEILGLLWACGLEEIEIGWVGKPGLEELIATSQSLGCAAAVSLWSRLKSEDIRRAARLGVSRINIGVPASGLHQSRRLKCTPEQIRGSIREHVRLARDLGLETICLGLEDASRADTGHLRQILHTAAAAGADRIRLSDTVGVLDPARTTALVQTAASIFPGPIGVHCHNDLGMATANTVTALDSGATWADVSVLGLGERCGIARLEEVAAYLAFNRRHSRYDLSAIRHLCLLVEKLAGVQVPGDKPICGRNIFAAESGLHVHGLLHTPELFEPFAPEQVGADAGDRRLGWGEKSGRGAIRSALHRLYPDQQVQEETVDQVWQKVQNKARELGRPLSTQELDRL